ncbi:hypothetical protein KY284_010175 [Solanum tuberosum]|nr:hypothetical protein KY284_010175 [Solanum tuberosum]
MARFFWGSLEGKQIYCWSAWDKMNYTTDEGGLGLRRLQDVSESLNMKRWYWKFRTTYSLWSKFLNAKYCRFISPIAKLIMPTQSLIWKKMLRSRDRMEERILWKINGGNINLWWDNWTNMGAVTHIIHLQDPPMNSKVVDIINNGVWNIEREQDTTDIASLTPNVQRNFLNVYYMELN